MPTYTFKNKDTGKVWDESMSISDSEKFLRDNPNMQKVPIAINMVRSVMGQKSMKTDSGWKENLSRIAEAHPRSALADRHGKKSIKELKTKQVVEKHMNKRKK